MTHSPEAMAMARRVVADVWKSRNENAAVAYVLTGQCDNYREVQAAVAAIELASKAAADFAYGHVVSGNDHRSQGRDETARKISSALRAFEHLRAAPNPKDTSDDISPTDPA